MTKMSETEITTYYQLIVAAPEDPVVQEALAEIAGDPEARESWHVFLAEQFLAGNLSEAWKAHAQQLPGFREHLQFHQDIRDGIQTLHGMALRDEIRKILPREGPVRMVAGRRTLYLRLASAAAIIICLIVAGVLWTHKAADTHMMMAEGTPVLMVEDFVLEGISEHQLVKGIAQRVPAKLAATDGIYALTPYAVKHVSNRVDEAQRATTLRATHRVLGEIRRTSQGFQVEANLMDIAKDRAIWSALYDVGAGAKDIDDMYDQIALNVTRTLGIQISDDARARLIRDVSGDPLVVELFLEGEYQWMLRTPESLEAAIDLFGRALAIDSSATLVRGYLALAHDTYAANGYGDEHWNNARLEAMHTLRDDPENPEALLVLGDYAESVDKDYRTAEQYFLRAEQIQPGDARIHQELAELYIRTGDLEKGKTHIVAARAIEPEYPSVRWVETKYLTAFGLLEEAKQAADDLRMIYPDYLNIRNFDWQYHLTKHEYDEAIVAIAPGSDMAYWKGLVYLEQKDFAALASLFPERSEMRASFIMLEASQKGQWDTVYSELSGMLAENAFNLIALLQTTDLQMFRTLKEDPGVQKILGEYGMRVHQIPEYQAPEI